MTIQSYIAWDIGGAHLKVAAIDSCGQVNYINQIATPLWQGFDSLELAVNKIFNELPEADRVHAVTMTAELADIFVDRETGVIALCDFIENNFQGERYKIYAGDNGFVDSEGIESNLSNIASANWHATSNFCARQLSDGVLIDIGSTTTDIIPFSSGKMINLGWSDHERLRSSELVYTGIVRTPVMAVVSELLFDGQVQNIAAENFASMADVYRVTEELNEVDDMMPTADGRDKTLGDSARRLLRMVGLDYLENLNQAKVIAEQVSDAQLMKIEKALLRLLSGEEARKIKTVVGAGAGQFLVHKIAERNNLEYKSFSEVVTFENKYEHEIISCAAAVSVAQIAKETWKP